MRDSDIRFELLARVAAEFADDPTTKIISELGFCNGSVRIDLAVINGAIHGYEIKSERDTLQRLPVQRDAYGRVCNFLTIVAAKSHLDKIAEMVPAWWGIKEATSDGKFVVLQTRKEAVENPHLDPFAIAQLLWREEALELLRSQGWERGFISKPRRVLWEKLASEQPPDDLARLVRERLKNRPRTGVQSAHDKSKMMVGSDLTPGRCVPRASFIACATPNKVITPTEILS